VERACVPDLVFSRRFGAIAPGATRADVRDALGEPDATHAHAHTPIWVYGKTLCRGHLEFHFLDEKLWMIWADYLPLRRYRSARFAFDRGCLGGLTSPSVAVVLRALADGPGPERRGMPAGIDPPPTPPPASVTRVGTRAWAKAVRRSAAHASTRLEVHEVIEGSLTWPSGAALGVGYRYAAPEGAPAAPRDARLVGEAIVVTLSVPMLPDAR
jgi:hypothetical protein